jgi:polysaccharide export outer membrane protein
MSVGGCAAIPSDGPSERVITAAAKPTSASPLLMVDLSFQTAQIVESVPPASAPSLANAVSHAPNDIIGEGDVLAISIFEPTGASLFQVNNPEASMAPLGSGQESLPRVLVSPEGMVDVPFTDPVHVAGLTPAAAGKAIRAALSKRVANPQVLVSVISSSANSVSVLGEVRTVGRFPLAANADRLLDIITLAGGPTKPSQDIDVEIVRGDQMTSAPMAEFLRIPAENVRLAPRDQVRLIPHERKYDVFGAFGHVAQTPIVDDRVSLAGAISRVGGLDTWSANNSAVYVFRFERPEVVKALGLSGPVTPRGTPIVYHLDMRTNAAALLIADSFYIRDGDLLYVPRADLVTVTKFMQAVNALAQAGYSIKVTGVP